MEIPERPAETLERLEYAAAMLSSLSMVVAGAGSPLLMYFLALATAQARDEASLAADCAPRKKAVA